MTSWTKARSFPPPDDAPAVSRPAAGAPCRDPYCIDFCGVRLHTIACDVKNGRDPILENRIIRNYAMDPRD